MWQREKDKVSDKRRKEEKGERQKWLDNNGKFKHGQMKNERKKINDGEIENLQMKMLETNGLMKNV